MIGTRNSIIHSVDKVLSFVKIQMIVLYFLFIFENVMLIKQYVEQHFIYNSFLLFYSKYLIELP